MKQTQFTLKQRKYLLDCVKGIKPYGPINARERQAAMSLFKRGLLDSDLHTLTPRGHQVWGGMRNT